MIITPTGRQFIVAAATQFAGFTLGGAITYPTILMEQFRINDTTAIDMHTRSWMGSIHGLAGIPAISMPILAQRFGRKIVFMISCLLLMTGWILAFTAKSTAQILISESFHGLGANSISIVTLMSLSEMIAPKYRHISMQMYSVIDYSGVTVGGILGRYLHYRTISLIMLSSVCIALAIASLWPESPYWLACRGDFEKCEENFLKLRGKDEVSKKELKELIAAQAERLGEVKVKKTITFRDIWMTVSNRQFYVSIFHTLMLLQLFFWSGSTVILIYFIEIVSKLTNDKDVTRYAGIGMYLVSFVGSIITTFLVSRVKNKSIILFNACGVIFCLICCFAVTGLQSLGVVAKDSYLPMYFMVGYRACNGLCVTFFVAAEIIPVKYRNIGGALYIIFNSACFTSSLKLSPYLFLYIGLSGTFLVYTVNAVCCTLFIWKYVPETKGKTLQELEDFYTHGRFVQRCNDNAEAPMASEES